MPSGILEPDMVNVTEPPSSTDVVDSATLTVATTSPIVITLLVATIGPAREPVLISIEKVSFSAERISESFVGFIEDGYDVITLTSSCALMMKYD